MERLVGRQGRHVDNHRREPRRQLRIWRRDHPGGQQYRDAEQGHIRWRQWAHGYPDKNQRHDGVGVVAQSQGNATAKLTKQFDGGDGLARSTNCLWPKSDTSDSAFRFELERFPIRLARGRFPPP